MNKSQQLLHILDEKKSKKKKFKTAANSPVTVPGFFGPLKLHFMKKMRGFVRPEFYDQLIQANPDIIQVGNKWVVRMPTGSHFITYNSIEDVQKHFDIEEV